MSDCRRHDIFYCREIEKRVLELERKVEKCASKKRVKKLEEEIEDIQSQCNDNFMHTKDGYKKNGDYYGEAYPYWWVDLGTNCNVKRIKIYNRTSHCCGKRLHDLKITIGKRLSNMKLCARFKGPAVPGHVLDMNCKIPTSARDVKLMIMDKSLYNWLHVAEVEVFA